VPQGSVIVQLVLQTPDEKMQSPDSHWPCATQPSPVDVVVVVVAVVVHVVVAVAVVVHVVVAVVVVAPPLPPSPGVPSTTVLPPHPASPATASHPSHRPKVMGPS
jgi:hypothetical protein